MTSQAEWEEIIDSRLQNAHAACRQQRQVDVYCFFIETSLWAYEDNMVK